MRTQEEAEAWAAEHSAVLKVDFAEKKAALQVGGFAAYSNTGAPLAHVLPELTVELERQMGERPTPREPLAFVADRRLR